MEAEVELEKAKNEVLRKIGRNMLLFQKVEHMLKFLIANGTIEGPVSKIRETQAQLAAATHKQTMGQLVGQFLKTHIEAEEVAKEPEELTEAHFAFTFRLRGDAVYCETKKQALASIVSDRNDLIHHLLPRLDLNSIEGCVDAEQRLDQQHERLLPELDALESTVGALETGRKELAEILRSDEFKKQFKLSWLRQSRLIILLGEIADQAARPDGWTLLNTAGQIIRQHAPEEVAMLHERYGYKNLKGLMLETELFDIIEEPTVKDGTRVLYRLKPEWTLQNA